MPSHRQQKPFAKVAFTASTPEEFGVLFMKKILRSASDNKITSADSKSLVVPFAVTVTRPSHEGLGKLDTVDCVQTCWSCLGHQVFCVSKCTTIHQELSPGRTPPGDETLRRLVTPGPPLANPELVEQGLATVPPPGRFANGGGHHPHKFGAGDPFAARRPSRRRRLGGTDRRRQSIAAQILTWTGVRRWGNL